MSRLPPKIGKFLSKISDLGVIFVLLLLGIVPLSFLLAYIPKSDWLIYLIFAGLNTAGWTFALALYLARRELREQVRRVADTFGIESRFRSFETVANKLLYEVERKNSALITNIAGRKVSSKDELARTLERIVSQAFKLFSAESAELALFDRESGLYHSSFVLGQPSRKSAQAMLAGAVEQDEEPQESSPDVLIEPLAFAGTVLGSLRVGLGRGRLPTQGDKEIIQLLAMQAGLAIINAEFVGELMRMRHASDESVRVKTGFLANLSHEIRGPLGIMLNAVELVLDGLCGPVSDDQLNTLKMVRSNGEHLLELINDVLDYAKAESGKITVNKTEIVVNDLLKDLCGVVRAQADAKGHSLTIRPNSEVMTISCDRRHIRQMLINLLTNAIKYTPDKGQIELWSERVPGNKIKISVKDNGVGIEESERSKVFSPFERIENAYSIQQSGTGLGMSLTKKLAEVNGATIDFESFAGNGSHFWLVFPAVEFAPTAVEEPQVNNTHAAGKGELILVIDPETEERAMVIRYLSHIGFRAAGAGNRLDALQIVRSQDVALVILDNTFMDSESEPLSKALRDNTKAIRLPLVLVSSRAFVFDIEKYLRAGIDRCLSKPISLRELGKICRQLIDGDIKNQSSAELGRDRGAMESKKLVSQDRQRRESASGLPEKESKEGDAGKMESGREKPTNLLH